MVEGMMGHLAIFRLVAGVWWRSGGDLWLAGFWAGLMAGWWLTRLGGRDEEG